VTLDEARRLVDHAINTAFIQQQDAGRTDYVTVRIDQNPENPEAFQAFIHAPERDHPRARMIVLSALARQVVTFP